MSFGDLKSLPKPGAPSPVPQSVSLANELRAHLRALSANSASLRNWEGSSSAADAASEVTRVRSLRNQNRDLVRKCASLLAQLEDSGQLESDPALRAEVEELKELYRQRIEDFAEALPESLARERDAIAAAQVVNSEATVASLPELGNSRQSNANGGVYNEGSGLLRASANDAALVREYEGTARLREERVTALREIERSVEDVNVTMTELASLIGEQESTLEYVAVNIEESSQVYAAAHRELLRARRGRERKQKLFYSILAVVALIIAMLIVILLS